MIFMEKRHYACIGFTIVSVAAIAYILSKKKCRDNMVQECHERKGKMRRCCSKNKGKHCCNNEKEVVNGDPNGMWEEAEQPYYSETYYVKDQKEEA